MPRAEIEDAQKPSPPAAAPAEKPYASLKRSPPAEDTNTVGAKKAKTEEDKDIGEGDKTDRVEDAKKEEHGDMPGSPPRRVLAGKAAELLETLRKRAATSK